MQLIINTNEELSATDREILALLTGSSAPKPAAKKAAAAKPEPDPEPEAEDLVGGDAPTMADAVALATKFVAEGKSARVKEVLADCGAKKVSELPEDKISAFVTALSG